jgi:hypothetical protein
MFFGRAFGQKSPTVLLSSLREKHQKLSPKILILILIQLSTAIGLTPGGSTHLHTNNTQNITINNKTTRIANKTTQITNLEACWPCPVFANYTLAFALQLREKHGKTPVRVAEEIQSIHTQDTHTLQKPPIHTYESALYKAHCTKCCRSEITRATEMHVNLSF